MIRRHSDVRRYDLITRDEIRVIRASSIGLYGAEIGIIALDLNMNYYGYMLAKKKITEKFHLKKVRAAIQHRGILSKIGDGAVREFAQKILHALSHPGVHVRPRSDKKISSQSRLSSAQYQTLIEEEKDRRVGKI